MPQVINTNIMSLNSQRQLDKTTSGLQTAMERLSSGLRINSAKDDAAGLAITDRMTSQIRGLNQAIRNANDGISLAQVAEGAMSESTNILQRMRELAIQSANDSNSAGDRANIQKEVNQLQSELERIASSTSFNGKNLLDGTFTAQSFHIGAFANQSIDVNIQSTKTDSIGNYQVGAQYITSATAGAAAAPAAAVNAITAQTLTVNGAFGSATVGVTVGQSADQIVGNINAKTEDTGVSASAITYAQLDIGLTAANTASSLSIQLNGTTISASIDSATTVGGLQELANNINQVTGQTGVTARLNEAKTAIMLSDQSGADIKVGYATAGTNIASVRLTGIDRTGEFDADVTADVAAGTTPADSQIGAAVTIAAGNASVVGGNIVFDSTKSYSVTSTAATIVLGSAQTGTLVAVDTVDISTQRGANEAISILDGALAAISESRADLGAIQNRMGTTIANLQNVSQNVSAARSRIQDADFAAETSNLTRAQILQQAGTAMLAQANAAPQSVLSLLG